MKTAFKIVFDTLSGFGFAVVLLVLMLLIVFLGTLYQVDHGLYAAQEKYFNSAFVVHHFFDRLPVTLPGGYLLLALFSLNLVLGGLVRIRKRKQTVGIIIGHVGMIVMLVGGLVTYHFSDSGNMQLYEGETSNEFLSYYDWTVEVGDINNSDTVHVIDQDLFTDLNRDKSRTFTNEAWPFSIVLSDYMLNAFPMQMPSGEGGKSVDGFRMEPLPAENEAEVNQPGLHVAVIDNSGATIQEGLLWGMAVHPLTVNVDGDDWAISMERKRWTVPFQVTLDDFQRELHPGTSMPASFESYITKQESGVPDENIRIYMNHPLRYQGYTFFQASWGPQNAEPDTPLFSVFAVVRNPADQVPLISCIIIGAGLLLHFGQKLLHYLKVENERRMRTQAS